MPKKVLVALPSGLLEQIDYVAQTEHRTRSDLIREALRRYLDNFKRTQIPTTTRLLHAVPTTNNTDSDDDVYGDVITVGSVIG